MGQFGVILGYLGLSWIRVDFELVWVISTLRRIFFIGFGLVWFHFSWSWVDFGYLIFEKYVHPSIVMVVRRFKWDLLINLWLDVHP